MDIRSLNYTIMKSICKLTEKEGSEFEKGLTLLNGEITVSQNLRLERGKGLVMGQWFHARESD